MRENPAIFEALDVSNPLRVEGDCRIPSWSRRKIQFLIHYGWRGTKHDIVCNSVCARRENWFAQ